MSTYNKKIEHEVRMQVSYKNQCEVGAKEH